MHGLTETSNTPPASSNRHGRILVSVVLSFRNEADTIPAMIARLDAAFATEHVAYEIIYVNDASTDASLAVLLKERERNPRVKVLNLSRRFGVAEGVLAGMAAASGDVIVYMDADLQDPPELIPTLLVQWRAGADVVHTIRTRRHGEHPLKMWLTRLGYRAIQFGSTVELPINAGDFKLLSRHVVWHLLDLHESDPYIRGLVAWIGFNQAFVTYERQARHAGRTHFPLFSRGPWKAFIVGFSSFSFLPVYVSGIMAAAGFVIAVGLLAAALPLAFAGSHLARPFAIGGAIGLLWSTAVGAVAAVGLYVIRIYNDVRRRPAYIVQSSVGIGTTMENGSVGAAERRESR
jgi:glycosyltransferase involved in cell wall biosynthesis